MHYLHELHIWLEGLNSMIYLVIAAQFWKRAKIRTEAAKAFYFLTAIFVFCGLTRLLPYAFAGQPWADAAHIILMIPLIGVGLWFVFRQEILHIAEAIERDSKRIEQIVEIHKSRIKGE